LSLELNSECVMESESGE